MSIVKFPAAEPIIRWKIIYIYIICKTKLSICCYYIFYFLKNKQNIVHGISFYPKANCLSILTLMHIYYMREAMHPHHASRIIISLTFEVQNLKCKRIFFIIGL
jgi:uncharacterized membrane protein